MQLETNNRSIITFEHALPSLYHINSASCFLRDLLIVEITSSSFPSKKDIIYRDDFSVHDKLTFRQWCKLFSLDIDQLCILFNVSKPTIYKYIDVSSNVKLRKPIIICCNLMLTFDREDAERYLFQRLSNTCHPWPSRSPIGC